MTDTREQLRGIARGGSLNLAGAVVSAAAAFLLVVIVTNTMNQSDAGQFFSGTSMFMIAFALSMLGTDAGLSRFTSLHLVNGQPEAVRACWSTAVRITLCLAIVVAVLAIIFRHQLADIMGMTSPDAPAMVAILALGLPPATLMGVSLSATRSLATMRPTVLIDKVLRTVGQTACALLALVVGGGLLSLGYAWSVPYIVGGGLALFMMRRFAARRLSPRNDAIAPTGVRREFWRFTWPRSVAQVSQMTIQRADIIIIGALISPAAAAIYTAATRFVAFGQFGTQAIQQTIQPRFANLLAAGKHTVLGEVYRTSTAWSILVVADLPGGWSRPHDLPQTVRRRIRRRRPTRRDHNGYRDDDWGRVRTRRHHAPHERAEQPQPEQLTHRADDKPHSVLHTYPADRDPRCSNCLERCGHCSQCSRLCAGTARDKSKSVLALYVDRFVLRIDLLRRSTCCAQRERKTHIAALPWRPGGAVSGVRHSPLVLAGHTGTHCPPSLDNATRTEAIIGSPMTPRQFRELSATEATVGKEGPK